VPLLSSAQQCREQRRESQPVHPKLKQDAAVPWDASRYNEDDELSAYVCEYFGKFLTPHENHVFYRAFWESKAAIGDESRRAMIHRRFLAEDNPAVIESLRGGVDAFRLATCRRILAEHGDEVFVNRCARCQRVVATP
jgi:hypothetical protein